MRGPLLLGCALALGLSDVAFAGDPDDPRPGDVALGKEGGIAYISDEESVTNPDFTQALATCPKVGNAWRLTGGGFRIAGVATDSEFTASASRPQDLDDLFYGDNDENRDDYWEAAVDAPIGTTVESFAICSKFDRLKTKDLDVPDGSSTDRKATTRCGQGKITGGGGFVATSDSFISSLYPADQQRWKVRLHDSAGGPGGMESLVICARGENLKLRKDSSRVPPGNSRASFVKCRANEHVVGGGAKSTGRADAMNLFASYPLDLADSDTAPDDAWQANAYNRSGSQKQVKAFVICAR